MLVSVLVGVDRRLLELLLALTLDLGCLGLYAKVGCIGSIHHLALGLELAHLVVHLVVDVGVGVQSL